MGRMSDAEKAKLKFSTEKLSEAEILQLNDVVLLSIVLTGKVNKKRIPGENLKIKKYTFDINPTKAREIIEKELQGEV